MRIAPYVVVAAGLLAVMCCVFCAFAWWKVSGMVTKLRSMSSALAELAEIRDYLTKIDAWSKRLNSRLVMQERNRQPAKESAADEPELDLQHTTDKRVLRRALGIVPGRPLPHK